MYREAQAQVKRYIETHHLRPGDPLPPEGVLAEQLGISRLSMREAMKSLEALGIVEARQGNGVYVKAFSFTPILDNLPYSLFVDGKSLGDVLQVREALEEGLLAMAMAKMSTEDFDQLDTLVDGMAARASTGVGFEDLDRAFHQRLFAPLNNPIVLRLIEVFWETYHRLEGNVVPFERDLDRVVALHRAIVAALRSGDVGAATDAMRRHFDPVWARIRGVLPEDFTR
ncbi:MAG: GntR family transcriptional regulator [Dehalococcoidia bacterium]|nr:MAG: GntR family transcriptional regulator [Dehalococcoidia bacterium]